MTNLLKANKAAIYNVHAFEFSHLQNTDYICAKLIFYSRNFKFHEC